MNTLLSFDKVNAYYGNAHILHDFSIDVKEGESLALIGRNGVGKTTFVNALLGQAKVRSGSIRLGRKESARWHPYMPAKEGVMVVPQGRCIIANLSVEENLLLGAATGRKGYWTVPKIYGLFPILRERAHTPGTALSGGQQQMLAIGRALMGNPTLMILDEPTEGLAPVIVDQLGDIIRQVNEQGTTILLIEQNLHLVARVSRRYLAVEKGSVIAEGIVDPEQIEQLQQFVVV
ncbi:ABC transporter ATP-binding protein [Marinobacterium lutimaris]|uniref:Amino acid/amide ABC transporter ATP-binding protein 2, HAAT family n=1 Tax=Marinobacterium lutimaris TaxID=568106 RepID=A0A1H5XZJ2_9GAMM|nr:ABC transporter ATP-binding protein [Marinobacterium lutimaris]SEG17042.1 amino acid/amide ABC transporter ATP-binding protein 2, HAAT family [Marinobacterium lutimaris]